jgi:hypothetical protein
MISMKLFNLKNILTFTLLTLPLQLFAATGTLTPASYDYGNVTIGSVSTQVFTLTPAGGALTVTSATVSAAPFSKIADTCTGAVITFPTTCTVTVQYTPTAVTTSAGTLTVVTNATDGTQKISSLFGTGVTGPSVTATMTPASNNFGSVSIGSSSAATFTVENTGGTVNLTIASATVAAPFTKTIDTCTGSSLPIAGTCTIEVTYFPTAVTVSLGTLTVVTNATNGSTKISSLTGTGTTGPTVTATMTPASNDFGSVSIGSTSTATFTVENTGGTVNLTIASATVAAPFTKTTDTCTGSSLPFAGTCTIEITYFPTAATISLGTLTVVTNATNGSTKISSLTGTGTAGPTVTGSITPATNDFGSVTVGSLTSTTFTVENTGGSVNLTITSATVSTLPFLKTADDCTGTSLAFGDTCDIVVSYFPTTATSSAAVLTVLTNATNGTTKIVSLTGTGVSGGSVTGSITPTTYSFSDTNVGSTNSHTFTVENTGGVGNLNITTVTVTAATPFSTNSDTCAGASLAFAGTCTVNVVFSPTDVGVFAGTLTVVTNAGNGSNKIASFNGSTTSPGTIAFSAEEYQFNNDVGTAVLYVTRTGGSAGAVSVDYTTSPGTASEVAGDYEDTDGTLTWADGDSSPKSINITINDTSFDDDSRTFSVILSANSGNATLGTNTATVELFDLAQSESPATDGSNGGAATDSSGCTSNGSSNSLGIMLTAMVAMLALKRRRGNPVN